MKVDKRTTTTKCLVHVIFVLVGMMVIVPAITEKAHASIAGHAFSPFYTFSKVIGIMYPFAGIFTTPPKLLAGDHDIVWATAGYIYGNEFGQVNADVGGKAVQFHFFNPAVGRNDCFVVPPELGSCSITQGVHSTATYHVSLPPPAPGANGGDTNSGDEDDSGDTP